jgi:hypothetical protein
MPKTAETRPKLPSFRNALGTVPGVYEETTIAPRTPQVLAVTMVFGTCGVFEIEFWRNTPFALPTYSCMFECTKFSIRKSGYISFEAICVHCSTPFFLPYLLTYLLSPLARAIPAMYSSALHVEGLAR